MKTRAWSSLAGWILAGTAVCCRAGQMETLASGAERQFEASRLRLIGPSGKPREGVNGSMVFAFPPFRKVGAAEVDAPFNGQGAALVASAMAIDASPYGNPDTAGAQPRAAGLGGLTGGVRQRLFRAGAGNETGTSGVFCEPYVGAGLGPMLLAYGSAPPGPGEARPPRQAELLLFSYVEGGLNLNLDNKVAVGAVARRYSASALDHPDTNFIAFTLTLMQDFWKGGPAK